MWVISDFMRGDHGTAIKHQQLVQGCRSKGIAAVNGVEAGAFPDLPSLQCKGSLLGGVLALNSQFGYWLGLTCYL